MSCSCQAAKYKGGTDPSSPTSPYRADWGAPPQPRRGMGLANWEGPDAQRRIQDGHGLLYTDYILASAKVPYRTHMPD